MEPQPLGPGAKTDRIPAHALVRYESRNLELEGVLTDISQSGAFLSTDILDAEDTPATLRFKNYLAWEELAIECRVARIVRRDETSGMGLRFTSLDAQGETWLRSYMRHYNGRSRIVMVDDDPFILRIMEKFLTQEGYKFVGIETPVLTPEIVERFQPGLIILDVMMPGLDGTELAEKLLANPNTHSIPIVFYSAGAPASVENHPEIPFVAKGIRPRDFVTQIRSLLPPKTEEQSL